MQVYRRKFSCISILGKVWIKGITLSSSMMDIRYSFRQRLVNCRGLPSVIGSISLRIRCTYMTGRTITFLHWNSKIQKQGFYQNLNGPILIKCKDRSSKWPLILYKSSKIHRIKSYRKKNRSKQSCHRCRVGGYTIWTLMEKCIIT